MFDPYREQLNRRFQNALLSLFGEPVPRLVWSHPPKVQLGDLASPVAFDLAKRVRKAPAEIARELLRAAEPLPGIARADVAGGGYINLFLDRPGFLSAMFREVRSGKKPDQTAARGKRIIEHTNINPNKAAHVGHLRNAVLGDTLGRAFRYLGENVEIQNYIDDTGVQVADVVLGMSHLRGIDRAGIDSLPGRLDYYLWDLYREITERYEKEPALLERRRQVLRDLEAGQGDNARLGREIAVRVVRRHVETMQRINVTYDLLPWEGDILAEKFWDKTFRNLRESGTAYQPEKGKLAGCWVMRIQSSEDQEAGEEAEKVLVRSDGTVTYIGKDIAYQLWKFGLLNADFSYRPFFRYPDGREIWSTERSPGPRKAPSFGQGQIIYNVIDSRQARLQRIVAEGLRALGHPGEAERSIHFSYEMVKLSRACAEEMGFLPAGSDPGIKSVEISGRKGQGIKADDLIDIMSDKATREVGKRNPDFSPEEIRKTAETIAVGALRYFMIKFNRNRVITFDFQDALSFEGDTGPYIQYSVVRASNILRKIKERSGWTPKDLDSEIDTIDWTFLTGSEEGDLFWDILFQGSQWRERVLQATDTLELSQLARFCFQLSKKFNGYYHRYPVIQEKDKNRKWARMLLVYLYRQQMVQALDTMGIEVPDRM
ncbi:MAG: arginine--tRNA ligase [Acidobacteria bacterium]|nr:arginine--tRNA ligase [Acidobacteriota bacterium]